MPNRPVLPWLRLGLLLIPFVIAACGTRTFMRPTGPALPAPDAAQAWAAASSTCAHVQSYAGTLSLTGRIGDQRVRGLASATLEIAVDRAARIAMEARIAGQVLFRLGGNAERAVLWLRQDNRVVTAGAAEVLSALVGAGFEPSRLREILAGCPATVGAPSRAERYGRVIQVETGSVTMFLEPARGGWAVRAWTFEDWDIAYDRVTADGPQRVLITSRPGVTPVVELSLRVNQAERNVEVPDAAFSVLVPEGARPMTLDDLRASGPLAERDGRDEPVR